MAPVRRRRTLSALVALGAVGALAQPAAALHGGAVVDCGTVGTFTLRTTQNGGGFQAPPFGDVLLFEGGGTLAPLVAYIDGELAWDDAAVGMAHNAVDEVTCTFTLANGVEVEVTGVFNPRP